MEVVTFHDSPRRAHSIAAQGGINAAKNYRNDGDSVQRLFYDTVKGGDYRAREANVYRLAQVSVNIIDQCVAQGVPFAREYGGLLDNRCFGGAQVSRTFYARGQTGQQLLLGAYQALAHQVHLGTVDAPHRSEMLDLVVKDGRAVGIVARDLVNGDVRRSRVTRSCSPPAATATCSSSPPTRSTATSTAIWRAHKRGAFFANPCYTQIHPTCIPASDEFQSKLTLMSESLRNDGRIWVPKEFGRRALARPDPRGRARLLPRAALPRVRQPRAPRRRVACGQARGRRRPRRRADQERRVPRLRDAIDRLGRDVIDERYDNLFQMYERITGEDPYQVPMRIYPAVHYTMGGLWVDYNLMSNVPGLYVLGEANFSDHGANRLGASGADAGSRRRLLRAPGHDRRLPRAAARPGRRSRPTTPCSSRPKRRSASGAQTLLGINGTRSVDWFHRELGKIMWDNCGMARSKESLEKAIAEIPALRDEFWNDVRILGDGESLNQSLEQAGRVADFLEFGELLCATRCTARRAAAGTSASSTRPKTARPCATTSTSRTSPPGSTPGDLASPVLHKEPLEFEHVHLAQRSYKYRAVRTRCPAMLALRRRRTATGRVRDLRGRRRVSPTCRSSSSSTCSTSG